QLRDVDEPLLTGKDLHEAPEVLDRDDSPLVHPAALDLLGQGLDPLLRSLRAHEAVPPDLDRAIVLDLDLRAGLLLDLLDHLAAGADHDADLLRIDAHDDDLR